MKICLRHKYKNVSTFVSGMFVYPTYECEKCKKKKTFEKYSKEHEVFISKNNIKR